MTAWILILACVSEPTGFGPMVKIEKDNGQYFFVDVYEFPNKHGVKPVAEMNLKDAKASCQSHGKRLCTMEEWKLACGTTRFTYGNIYEEDRCPTNQPNSQGHTSLMHGRTSQVESGSHPGCRSSTGIFDMNGNLEEWVLDDWRGLEGNLAGGAWYTHWKYADCSVRYSREPDYRLDDTRPTDSAGVRCCWSEWTPTKEDTQSDSVKHTVSNQQQLPPYDSSNEVQVADGFWMDRYEYPNVKGTVPRVGVDWFEADKLCKENGKSLCSVQEWELACTNGTQFLYPYGNDHEVRRCNDEGSLLIPAGDKETCTSDYGIADLTGNVWEWTSSDLTVAELQVDPSVPIKEIRGGSFVSDSRKAQCIPTVGYPLTPADTAMDSLGFRCCRVIDALHTPSPAQISEHDCPNDMRPHATGCIDQYEYPNQKGVTPMHSIALSKAINLCLSEGKHLCTEAEWSAGCTGPNNRRWSYGNAYDAKRCHHASQQYEGGALPAGHFPECTTPDGVSDMTGNLWEWNASGILRGGNWNFSEGMGQCRSIAKPAPHIQNDEIGLRCCATIKEAKALLNHSEKRL